MNLFNIPLNKGTHKHYNKGGSMDIRRAIVDDIPLNLIDDEFLNNLKSGSTMDFLVGKCLGLFTDVVIHQPNDPYYDFEILSDQLLEKYPNLNQIRISDGEFFINVNTGFSMTATSWQPSLSITYCENLITEHHININFFDDNNNFVTASAEYSFKGKKYFIECSADTITEAVCKVIIGKYCNICSIEISE